MTAGEVVDDVVEDKKTRSRRASPAAQFEKFKLSA
jgi:hypothetical protein